MEASYQGETGPDYDELIDVIASTCASDDESAIRELYGTQDLAVPASILT